MSDFNQRKKDALDFLKTQQEIEETIKRQTDSFSSYVDAQKKGLENAKAIKQIKERIKILTAEDTEESRNEAAILEKKVDYLQKYNKELLKTKTLLKAAAKATAKWGLEKLVSGGKNLLEMYNKMDKSARRNAVSIGMSLDRMNQFKTVAAGSAEQLTMLGLSVEAAGEMLGSYNEESGRQLMLSQENVKSIGALAERLGMSHQEVAGMAGQMEAFGLGADDSIKLVSEISDITDKMGVNTQKVMKKVQGNLKLVNKLNFKEGIKGMAKMAAYTEKYKVEMEDIAGLAEKVFRPEGAIDAAANLQVLGGGLAKLGDPFTIMYQARNAPEELAKSIVKSTNAVAQFNKKTGEFEVSAMDMDRFREASEATGISMEKMVEIAKTNAKVNMFEGMIGSGVGKEEKEFLTSVAQMRDGKGMIFDKGQWKPLSEFSASDAKRMMEKKKNDEEADLAAQTTQERIMNMWNSILAKLMPALDAIEQEWGPKLIEFGKTLVNGIKSFLDNKWLQKLVLGLFLLPTIVTVVKGVITGVNIIRGIFGAGTWFRQGVAMRKGFDSAGGMSNVTGEQGGITEKLKGNTKPSSNQTSSKPTTQTNGRQGGFMESLSKIKPTQLLALGAAIIMIAGAIWILSDAMIRIKEANVGLEQFAIVGGSMIIMMGMMIPLIGALGAVGSAVSVPLLALGAAFLLIGGAIWLATQGFAAMFEAIGPNGDSIMKAGLGMLSMAGGIAVLTASLIALGFAAPIVGLGLAALWAATELLVDTAEKLEKTNIGTLVKDINAIDKEKLSMLKSLLYLSKEAKPIVVKFEDLKLDGDIKIKGGGETVTMMMQEPYLSKLKDKIWDAMEKGKGGGKL